MDPRVSLTFEDGRTRHRYDPHAFTTTLDWKDIQQLAASRQGLETRLAEIELHLQTGNHADAEAAVRSAREQATPLTNLSQVVENLVPAEERPPTAASTAKADEVFSTPELLEMIFVNLHRQDKLNAMQVQRSWRDTMLGSVTMKKSLGLISHGGPFYYSPFSDRFSIGGRRDYDNLPGRNRLDDYEPFFEWDADSEASVDNSVTRNRDDPYVLDLEVVWHKPSRGSSTIGDRIRQMLLCSPPVTTLQAHVTCASCVKGNGHFMERTDMGAVHSSGPSGFTIGDLADKTAELMATHPNCRTRSIAYTASIPLDEDDPILKKRLARRGLRQQEKGIRHEWRVQRAAAGLSHGQGEFRENGGYRSMGFERDCHGRLVPLRLQEEEQPRQTCDEDQELEEDRLDAEAGLEFRDHADDGPAPQGE
ncbi:uncharacterized protein CLAFUR5_05409 [Fulvia fulva]|uniref:F-box domain-containing protein n=1 Tax=Passalora fulva TaxID=5499 RepID=A0A9Q8P9J5_PASFU|nr:uncharacterized protein CLAFUR5_05409 [Fulvia fulva]KAK4624863.1 hypothetical protein CLAFUR0_05262 [Fulvia fulva]UJO18329.1 hypothetical protein CLAFUR5_05409 [Fulvia fulva]